MEHNEHSRETEILAALARYVDGYHWSWNMARRLINRYYGTQYTDSDLKKLYRNSRKNENT